MRFRKSQVHRSDRSFSSLSGRLTFEGKESDLFDHRLSPGAHHPVDKFLDSPAWTAHRVPEQKAAQRVLVAQRVFHRWSNRFGRAIRRYGKRLEVGRVADPAITNSV